MTDSNQHQLLQQSFCFRGIVALWNTIKENFPWFQNISTITLEKLKIFEHRRRLFLYFNVRRNYDNGYHSYLHLLLEWSIVAGYVRS